MTTRFYLAMWTRGGAKSNFASFWKAGPRSGPLLLHLKFSKTFASAKTAVRTAATRTAVTQVVVETMSNTRKPTHHNTSPYPGYGYVWFEDGPEKAAVIYGTSNNSAVCSMELADAKELLESTGDTVVSKRGNKLIATIEHMGDYELPISTKGMVLFDGSWTLYHRIERSMGRPSTMPNAWKKRANMD